MNEQQTKHTPGPWRSGDMFNTIFGPPNGNPAPEIIASVHTNRKANARLIAAAPELLEALKRCHSAFQQSPLNKDDDWVQGRLASDIRAAINKATRS